MIILPLGFKHANFLLPKTIYKYINALRIILEPKLSSFLGIGLTQILLESNIRILFNISNYALKALRILVFLSLIKARAVRLSFEFKFMNWS